MGCAAASACSSYGGDEEDVVVSDDIDAVNRDHPAEQNLDVLDVPNHEDKLSRVTQSRVDGAAPQDFFVDTAPLDYPITPSAPGQCAQHIQDSAFSPELTPWPTGQRRSWARPKEVATAALRHLGLVRGRGGVAAGPYGSRCSKATIEDFEDFAVELLELALAVSSGTAADCINISRAAVLDHHQALRRVAELVRRAGNLKHDDGAVGSPLKPRELATAFLNGAKSASEASRRPEMTVKGLRSSSKKSNLHLGAGDGYCRERKFSTASDFSATSFNDFNRRSMCSMESELPGHLDTKPQESATAVPSLMEFFQAVEFKPREAAVLPGISEACSNPVVVEIELAGQAMPGQIGNELSRPITPYQNRSGLALARDWASESVTQQSGLSNAMTYHSCCEAVFQTGGEEKEIVQAEVVNLPKQGGASNEASTRLRIAFRSKCLRTQNEWQRHLLAQQRDLLKIASTRLEAAQRVLHKDALVNIGQRELLRGFRKIVTRELTHQDAQARANVYVVDKQDELRAEVEQMCGILEYPCQAFRHLNQAKMVVAGAKSPILSVVESEYEGGPVCTPSSMASSTYTYMRGPVSIVLLGSSWLDRELPKEWNAQEDVVVVLTSKAEDFEDVGRRLLASGESEIRERLRERGICDYLLYPLSLDSLQGAITQAVRRSLADEFLLAEVLGRGNTGVVHLAKRLRDGMAFALKEVNTRRLTPIAKQDVEREIKLLQECSWPTVLTVVDAWECKSDNLRYMLMPLCKGGNLMQRIEAVRGGCGLKDYKEQVVGWYSQTLHGLTYLHWRGVLHRDLKPENLLVAECYQMVQIGDLGSATLLPGVGPHPIRRKSVRGLITTPNYAAAEVCMESTYMSASDIWSVGVTFYEVMTLESLCPKNLCLKEIKEFIHAFDPEDPNPSSKNMAGPALAKVRDSGMQITSVELSELLRHNPLRRPSAAALANRPATWRRLQRILGKFWLLDSGERKSHLALFKEVTRESEEALEMEPPQEVAASLVPGLRRRRSDRTRRFTST